MMARVCSRTGCRCGPRAWSAPGGDEVGRRSWSGGAATTTPDDHVDLMVDGLWAIEPGPAGLASWGTWGHVARPRQARAATVATSVSVPRLLDSGRGRSWWPDQPVAVISLSPSRFADQQNDVAGAAPSTAALACLSSLASLRGQQAAGRGLLSTMPTRRVPGQMAPGSGRIFSWSSTGGMGCVRDRMLSISTSTENAIAAYT